MSVLFGVVQSRIPIEEYHNSEEVQFLLQKWQKDYPSLAKIVTIGKSAGQRDLTIFRIAAKTENRVDPDYRPAIFVSANIEGVHLVGTEAALCLIEKLLLGYGSEKKITTLLHHKTVYIMPLMNPDAADKFLEKPHFEQYLNQQSIDDDLDGKFDEDHPNDLNKDGVITAMRVKDSQGDWIIDPNEPRLMRRRNQEQNDLQTYSVFTEGRDDDDDGKYNEDPNGGIELYTNFPYYFEYLLPKADIWPDSTNETAAIITFLVGHPNISLVLNFSLENTFLGFPRTYTNGPTNQVKLPKNFATSLGLDSGKEYTLERLTEIFKKSNISPNVSEMNEAMIASLVGISPIDSIAKQDSSFFTAVQNEYKEALKNAKLTAFIKRVNGIKKGSFLTYCYFQYGVPVFSSNLYTIPETKKKIKRNFDDPDLSFLKISDQFLDGQGFIDWQPYKHPDLGEVEIGGFHPFIKYNPRLDLLKESILFHTGFYVNLMTHAAELKIKEINVSNFKTDFYKVTAHFINLGWFPTATAYGSKKLRSQPIIVRLKTTKEQMIYAGETFEVIDFVGERGQVKKIEWTIKAKRGSKVILTADSPKIGSLTSTIVLE